MKQKQTTLKICESCARPLRRIRDYGLNADKTRNKEYCCFCFFRGEFKEPELEMEQMTNRVAIAMAKEMKMSEEQARLMAEKVVPNLKRWRQAA